ncbi:MAG: hypothetical protein KBC78_01130 [Candidatus Pacebacteria bacterium]|nr:hypothetical protein [Candidatus Paceibacterota bacterium]
MNRQVINQYNHLITSICVGLFLISIILYMYFLSLSVMHVVMRKEAIHNLNELRSEIARLESAYIVAQHRISTEVATVGGFSENENKIFISRAEQNLVLRSENE